MSVCGLFLTGGIERFVVLVGVEAIMERQELDDALRNRLKISEANVRSLKTRLAKVLPGAGADARTAG